MRTRKRPPPHSRYAQPPNRPPAMPSRLVLPPALLLAALLLVRGAAAQEAAPADAFAAALRAPTFFFDDMQYPAGADYERGRGGSPGTLFGPNPWLVARPGGDLAVEPHRAWYVFDWAEFPGHTDDVGRRDAPYAFQYRPDPGRVVMQARPGRRAVDDVWALASGFAAATGTWLTRVRLAPVPDRGDASAHYAFWTQTPLIQRAPYYPFFAPDQPKRWSEVNIELTNWPADVDARTTGPRRDELYRYVSGGITWAPFNRATPEAVEQAASGDVFFRAAPGAPRGTCRLWPTADAPSRVMPADVDADPTFCRDVLTRRLQRRGLDLRGRAGVWVYLLIRVTEDRVQHRIVALDEDADGRPADAVPGFHRLEMATYGFRHVVPPDPMTAKYSLSARTVRGDAPRCEGGCDGLDAPMELEIDWLYYTPDTTLDLPALRDEVARIRAALADRGAPPRASTLPGRGVEAPVAAGPGACQPAWYGTHPTRPFDVRLETYADRAAGLDARIYRLRLVRDDAFALRHGGLDVRWTVRETYRHADGRRRTRTQTYEDRGLRLAYAPDPAALGLDPARWRLDDLVLDVAVTHAASAPCADAEEGPATVQARFRPLRDGDTRP